MREYDTPPAVGGSSLLVIFAVLCLTIFALLGLSTVQADGRLSEASSRSVKGYYQADTEAEQILYRLRMGEVPEGVKQNGTMYSYVCTISDVQALEVEVRVEEETYEILKWRVVSTAEWKTEEGLDLWDGTWE